MSQQRIPSTLASACGNRFDRNAGSSSSLASVTWRSMSLNTFSTRILHPSSSPKNVTLVPTTGPRSSSSGCGVAFRLERNLPSALVGWTGESPPPLSTASGSSLRFLEKRSERDNGGIIPSLACGWLVLNYQPLFECQLAC